MEKGEKADKEDAEEEILAGLILEVKDIFALHTRECLEEETPENGGADETGRQEKSPNKNNRDIREYIRD